MPNNLTTLVGMYYGDKPVETLPYYANDEEPVVPYVRNPAYLPLPEISESENRIYMLVLVDQTNMNPIALSCNVATGGQYYVDWGDGTNVTANNNAISLKNYSFASLSAATEVTVDGVLHRQVVVMVRMAIEGNISGFTIITGQNDTTFLNTYRNKIVDFYASHSTLYQVYFNTKSPMLEKVKIDRVRPAGITLSNMCDYCHNLRSVELTARCQPYITTISSCFRFCYKLEEIGDLTLPICIAINNIFYECTSLKKVGNISAPIATNASSLFSVCRSLYSVGEIYAPLATNSNSMFERCSKLLAIPKMELGVITNAGSMFNECQNIRTIPYINLATGAALFNMFFNCRNLRHIPMNMNFLGSNMNRMFEGCASLETLPTIDLSQSTDNTSVFNGCSRLKEVNIGNITRPSTALGNMFSNCTNLETITGTISFSGTAVSYANLFNFCTLLKTPPSMTFNFGTGTTVTSMFYNMHPEALPIILTPLSGTVLNILATSVNSMFSYNTEESFPVTLNIPNVTDASNLFRWNIRLKTSPVITNSGAVTNWSSLFFDCFTLEDVSPINMAGGTSATNAFVNCNNLRRSQVYGIRCTHSYANCSLSQSALVEIFNNLGTAISGATITISGNFGAAALTAGERAIATGKGWTIIG